MARSSVSIGDLLTVVADHVLSDGEPLEILDMRAYSSYNGNCRCILGWGCALIPEWDKAVGYILRWHDCTLDEAIRIFVHESSGMDLNYSDSFFDLCFSTESSIALKALRERQWLDADYILWTDGE